MMDMAPINIIFGCVIAEQTQVEKISGARQKFERRKVSLIQWSSVRPHPADVMFFQKPDELWPMPSGVTKLNGEAEILWQLVEKTPQRQFAILRREIRWELDEDNAELCSKRFDGAEKQIQLCAAILQLGGMCDLAG